MDYTSAAEPEVVSGKPTKLKKCYYTGHCAAVWSVENAIDILDRIGYKTGSEDCLPFAIRLVENGELIQIAEDNGEFGCGDLLAECLTKLDKYNVLVCVSRKIIDSFVLDMFQRQKFHSIRDAANSAIDTIHAHFNSLEAHENKNADCDDDRSVIVRLPIPSVEGIRGTDKEKDKEKPRSVARVSLDVEGMLPNQPIISNKVGNVNTKTAKISSTKRKLKESILQAKTIS